MHGLVFYACLYSLLHIGMLIVVFYYTVYGKTFKGKNFCGFCRFLALQWKLSCVCFACYRRLFIIMMKWWHSQLVHETFPANGAFSCNPKSFPPWMFCCIQYLLWLLSLLCLPSLLCVRTVDWDNFIIKQILYEPMFNKI